MRGRRVLWVVPAKEKQTRLVIHLRVMINVSCVRVNTDINKYLCLKVYVYDVFTYHTCHIVKRA
jgi:hypothetical protein